MAGASMDIGGTSTRRAFLLRAAAAAGSPLLLGACRRAADAAAPGGGGLVPQSGPSSDPDDSAGTFEQGPARLPLPTAEPMVRVRVLKAHGDGRNAAARRAVIGPSDRWLYLRPIGGEQRGVVARGPVAVELRSGHWDLVDGQGYRPGIDGAQSIQVSAVKGESHGLELDGAAYPGAFRLVPRPELRPGAFDVVNDVPLEAYLPGVIAGELYRHWHAEAFAAQAIAARSYACGEQAYFRERRHFDLTNTTSSQVYLGAVEHDRSRDAVNSTRGVVLAHEQWLVPGYYSSCCGGVAARAIDAIGPNPMNDIPPLHGRSCSGDVCTGAKWYRWSMERSLDDLLARLMAFGRFRGIAELGKLAALSTIEITSRNDCGRPARIAVGDGRRVRIEMRAEQFRSAANFEGVRLPALRENLRSVNASIEVAGSVVRFDGGGFGHGAGMCQHGAQAMAEAGGGHAAILAHYYPGASLAEAWS